MSSVKMGLRSFTEACADCGSFDPSWALINRGLLVCDECCSIHWSLGRHISQVKALKKAPWSPTLLAMVQTLNNGSVNCLWEHSLSDSKAARRKPQPKDPLHPTKAEFIQAKHAQLSFVLRSSDGEEDLNQQLHSSVRTNNLETSLRLLAQGADPNYFHLEKGNRPLHVAARAGQTAQAELLVVYGADPGAPDAQGNSPPVCARLSGHRDLSHRLTECLYEVTDRLAYFLCRRKPDHVAGQHFLVPQIADCLETPQPTKEARAKLQMLTNAQFEDLAMDVYDEVDRRETEAIWLCSATSLHHAAVPFLPVNPELSAMRNQGRQKLARFNPREFATLVVDILYDARRRQGGSGPSTYDRLSLAKPLSAVPKDVMDDEPLYDSVASDDDYATAEQLAAMVALNTKKGVSFRQSAASESTVSSPTPAVPSVEHELRSQLRNSETRVAELAAHIDRLNAKVEEMRRENTELRSVMQQSAMSLPGCETETEPVLDVRSIPQRPASMYETREALRSQVVGSMPQPEEVVRRTDQVTKRIQELWASMQARHAFVPCAERIRVAVAELTAIFPQKPGDDVVRSALRQLNTSTVRLQAECAGLEGNAERVRTCAYHMAKATRQLLTRFQ